jgi:hypothetical protein
MTILSVQHPLLIMGPMVRRAEKAAVCIQFATSKPVNCRVELIGFECYSEQDTIRLGEYLFLQFVVIKPINSQFPRDTLLSYQLFFDDSPIDLSAFSFNSQPLPEFVIPKKLTQILHGS